MNDSRYDPFALWMLPLGIWYTWAQLFYLGNPGEVTRDQLGNLGRRR